MKHPENSEKLSQGFLPLLWLMCSMWSFITAIITSSSNTYLYYFDLCRNDSDFLSPCHIRHQYTDFTSLFPCDILYLWSLLDFTPALITDILLTNSSLKTPGFLWLPTSVPACVTKAPPLRLLLMIRRRHGNHLSCFDVKSQWNVFYFRFSGGGGVWCCLDTN